MIEDLEKEYLRAVEREGFIRAASFVLPYETICGMDILPMTLRHYIALRLINSPFVTGGTALPEDAFIFLWQMSPEYSPSNMRSKRNLLKKCRCFTPPAKPMIHLPWSMRNWHEVSARRLIRFVEVQSDIRGFVDEAMTDQPPSPLATGKSYFSYAAALCHEFASEYGWTVEHTLKQPLKILFQLAKIIAAKSKVAAGKSPLYFNKSDDIQNRILAELNSN